MDRKGIEFLISCCFLQIFYIHNVRIATNEKKSLIVGQNLNLGIFKIPIVISSETTRCHLRTIITTTAGLSNRKNVVDGTFNGLKVRYDFYKSSIRVMIIALSSQNVDDYM